MHSLSWKGLRQRQQDHEETVDVMWPQQAGLLLLASRAIALSKETLRHNRLRIVESANPEAHWIFLLFVDIFSKFCAAGMSSRDPIIWWITSVAGFCDNQLWCSTYGDWGHPVPVPPGDNDCNLLASECLLKSATFYSLSIIRDSFCSHKAVASNKARLTHSSGSKPPGMLICLKAGS